MVPNPITPLGEVVEMTCSRDGFTQNTKAEYLTLANATQLINGVIWLFI